MKKHIFPLSLILFIAMHDASARAKDWLETGTVADNQKWSYWSVMVDAGKQTLKVGTKEGGAQLRDLAAADADVAVNGAYFLSNYRPAGWLFDGKTTLGKPNPKSSGAVFFVKAGKVGIAKLKSVPKNVDFAMQNSPVLVQPGGKVTADLNAVKRAWRTIICLPARDLTGRLFRVIVIKSVLGDGPTLKETADILVRSNDTGGFGCRQALNLDGGPSSGIIFPKHQDLVASPPGVPIGHALLLHGF